MNTKDTGGFVDEYLFSLENYSFEKNYTQHVRTKLRPFLKNVPLIDLGGRLGLSSRKLESMGVSDYTIVDTQDLSGVTNHKFIVSDAGEFVRNILAGMKMNFMANGLLVSEVIGRSEYAYELFSQIHRVITPYHGSLVVTKFDLHDIAQHSGFQVVEHVGDIFVYQSV